MNNPSLRQEVGDDGVTRLVLEEACEERVRSVMDLVGKLQDQKQCVECMVMILLVVAWAVFAFMDSFFFKLSNFALWMGAIGLVFGLWLFYALAMWRYRRKARRPMQELMAALVTDGRRFNDFDALRQAEPTAFKVISAVLGYELI